MDEIEQQIATLRAAGIDVWADAPPPPGAVADLEKSLNVALPPGYRDFVLRYGGMGIGDSFVSGILGGDAFSTDFGTLYGDTLRYRDEFNMPEHLLVIQSDEDAPFCLDSGSPRADGEYPVVCFELHSGHVSQVAPDFKAWLSSWLQSTIA